jgi:hypothetical protein
MDDTLKAVITLIGGAALGLMAKAWQNRSKASLLITSIDFSNDKESQEALISIPEDLQELSKKSAWCNNLPKQMQSGEIRTLIDEDLKETIEQLDNLCEFLPQLLPKCKEWAAIDQEEAKAAYVAFFTKTTSAETMGYYTMNIAGALRRNEIDLGNEKDWLPSHEESTFGKGLAIPKGTKKLDDVKAGIDTETSAINALQIATNWHPTLTRHVAETILHQVSPQAPLNRSIAARLTKLIDSQGQISPMTSNVTARVALANHGELPISLDRYSAIKLPGKLPSIFMEAEEPKSGYITLTPGQSINISYKSKSGIDTEIARSIKTLFSSKTLKCQIITKQLTHRAFTRKWICSDIVSLSDLSQETIEEYLQAASRLKL